METYYSYTWLSFGNKKNEKKKKKLKFINENYIYYFFKTTDLYTVYLFSEYADN